MNRNTETQIEELIVCYIVSNEEREDSNPGCLIPESTHKATYNIASQSSVSNSQGLYKDLKSYAEAFIT